LKIDQARRLK
jgi:hypothetical protein